MDPGHGVALRLISATNASANKKLTCCVNVRPSALASLRIFGTRPSLIATRCRCLGRAVHFGIFSSPLYDGLPMALNIHGMAWGRQQLFFIFPAQAQKKRAPISGNPLSIG